MNYSEFNYLKQKNDTKQKRTLGLQPHALPFSFQDIEKL